MAGLLTDPVEMTLHRWAEERFTWGETDCAMSIFRHIADAWGRDKPYRFWFRRYGTEKAAQEIVRQWGGHIQLFRKQMQQVGARRTRTPMRGDVGLIRDDRDRLVAGICLGGGWWAAKAETGFAACRPAFVVAWSREG